MGRCPVCHRLRAPWRRKAADRAARTLVLCDRLEAHRATLAGSTDGLDRAVVGAATRMLATLRHRLEIEHGRVHRLVGRSGLHIGAVDELAHHILRTGSVGSSDGIEPKEG